MTQSNGVYDVEMRKITLRLVGHQDDINAVCFADPLSTNVLFSGSDDSFVKVWDRRSMAGGREAGCLAGHMEGITFVASKGDGRYVISNGKDQVLKLWDIRKMMERSDFDALARTDYSSGFDYRWMVYPPHIVLTLLGLSWTFIIPSSPRLQRDNLLWSSSSQNTHPLSLFPSYVHWPTISLLWLRRRQNPYLES